MADREQEVQRSVQPAGGSSEQAGAQTTPDARMNVMRQRRAAAMRKGEGKGGAAPEVAIPEGGGAPLEGKTKQTMEQKLGADLSSVRIHTGGDSAGAAEKLNAQAFTVGSDVHFGAGKLDPNSKEGTKLLAHELTHVVQGQKGGVQKSEAEGEEKEADAEGKDGEALEVSDPEEPAEQEADAVAEKATEDLPNGAAGGEAGEAGEGGADVEAKGGEGEVAAEEKGEAETEEAAPEAAAKHNIGASPSAMNASVLRKILRKKAFRDEEKAAAPEAEAAAAPAGPAEDEKKEGEEAPAAEAASSEGAAPEAEAAAAPEAAAAGPEAGAEEKKPEEEAAPEAEAEEKVSTKRIAAKSIARKINRKVYRDEEKAAEPEAAAAPEAAAPEGEEKKADAEATAGPEGEAKAADAEGGAPEAASAEAAAPEAAAAPEGEEKKSEEEAPAAEAAPEAPAEEKVSTKRISAKRDTIQRKIFRAGPSTPPATPAPQAKPPTQQEIDALPKGAVQQVGGANNVTLDKGEVQGDKDMPDSVTVQQQAKTVSDNVKKYLKPETTPQERQALLAQITTDFAKLRTMMSEARGEGIDIIRLRTTFEKDIGAKATSGEFPGADAAVSSMVDKAISMIAGPQNQAVAAAETIAQKLEIMKQDPGLKAQIEGLGTKIDIGFAGAVGKSFEAISGALTGGSLVQKCLALINFGDSFLKPKLTEKSPQVLAQIKENLSSAEFEALEAKIKTAQEAKAGAGAANAPGSTATDAEKKKATGADKEAQKQLLSDDGTFASKVNDKGAMDEKTPDLPVEALDPEALKHLCKTKGIETEGQSPAELVEKLKVAGVTTSGAANMADGAAGVTVQGMPFLQGIQANIVHPDHEWIANATKAEMPLKAGISGTTHRFLGMGNLLGVDDKPGMRLAMLGHLQAIEAHSFWEIVDASGMGQPAAGKYIPFAPVDDGQMTAAAKQTIAKDAQFAAKATGEGDQEAQAKRLLGIDKG